MSELQATAVTQDPDPIPGHVAIIMDGNHRWAKARNLPGSDGHRAGTENVRKVAEACSEAGVKFLTLFAFSTENWERPKAEVQLLMELMRHFLNEDVGVLHEHEVRLHVIGDRSRLAPDLRMLITRVEQMTRDHTRLQLNVAVNYGGRWDIVQAAQALAEQVRAGRLAPEEISEAHLTDALSLGQIPPPDLCIRTGGEQRISNFLLWDFAYTEFYFTEAYWPDFDDARLAEAFAAYGARQRRFGRRS